MYRGQSGPWPSTTANSRGVTFTSKYFLAHAILTQKVSEGFKSPHPQYKIYTDRTVRGANLHSTFTRFFRQRTLDGDGNVTHESYDVKTLMKFGNDVVGGTMEQVFSVLEVFCVCFHCVFCVFCIFMSRVFCTNGSVHSLCLICGAGLCKQFSVQAY